MLKCVLDQTVLPPIRDVRDMRDTAEMPERIVDGPVQTEIIDDSSENFCVNTIQRRHRALHDLFVHKIILDDKQNGISH